MSGGFTKLHYDIITSTIMGESPVTFKVFVTFLAMADRHGNIEASIPGLARITNLSIEDVEAALAKLMSPDKYSRTPDHEGRRIEQIEGGWRLLNHAKYREKLSADVQRENATIRKQNQRQRERGTGSVTERDSHEKSRMSPQAEAEAEAEAEAKAKGKRKKTNTTADAVAVSLCDELHLTGKKNQRLVSECIDHWTAKLQHERLSREQVAAHMAKAWHHQRKHGTAQGYRYENPIAFLQNGQLWTDAARMAQSRFYTKRAEGVQ